MPYRGDLTTVEGFKPIKINSIESKRALFDIKFNKKYRAKDESELLFNRSKAEITAYSLNKEHPTGKNKAVVFEKALGYNSNNADVLEKEIFKELGVYKAIPKGNDGHGEKYDVVMLITGANPKVQPVVTGWIFDNGVDFPRMVTTYVHKIQRP